MVRTPLLSSAVLAACVLSGTAQAGVSRSFVSATMGNDANTATNCARLAPCRTFQTAMTVVNPGGEVIAVDSGGYGPVTITQSVSLIAPSGVYAGIAVAAGDGVLINTPGVNVTLKGLTIKGAGGSNGIHMTNGAILNVENCTVSGFGTTVSFSESAAIHIDAAAAVKIVDTIVRDSSSGIRLDGGATAQISRVQASGNYGGIGIRGKSGFDGLTTANISGSMALNNTVGFWAIGQIDCAICFAILTVTDSVLSTNSVGIQAHGPGVSVLVSNNSLSGNNTSFQNINSLFNSAHNNLADSTSSGAIVDISATGRIQ